MTTWVISNEETLIDVIDDKVILQYYFSVGVGTPDEIFHFVDDICDDNNQNDTGLEINTPLVNILNSVIETHELTQYDDTTMCLSSKPTFDLIKNDLLVLIAKIDAIKFVSNKEE